GIGLGAISTFFVATPFLTVLMERAPDYRRRTEGDTVVKGVSGITVQEAEKLGLVSAAEALTAEAPALPEPVGAAAPAPDGDGARLGERAGESLAGVARQLGLVTRDELEELELRVAQLEHRLRLVEGPRAV